MEGSGMLSGGMLGSLDIPHHQQQTQQQPPILPPAHPHYAHQQHHPPPPNQTISFAAVDQGTKQQLYAGYKAKGGPPGSDEDEGDEGGGAGKRSASPWQRMKWTDSMVRLLITVVYYVGGDDGGDGVDKKKLSGGGGGGGGGVLLQKKGKWKSVSMAMMEKGFFVSPQQCEDKFNDLNKRYKRVNDIIGRGTACKVVENQSLLETMDHISPKMKEEVRKLLNSKHLFFREMCAYHSSCAQNAHPPAASPAAAATNHSDFQDSPGFHPQQQQPGLQGCFHDEEDEVDNAAAAADEDDEEEEDDEDEEEEDDDDVETSDRNKAPAGGGKKRRAAAATGCGLVQQLRAELGKVVEDGSKLSPWEQRDWIRRRRLEVEEQRVGFQSEALELEKQRFKWVKYSTKKERELERLRLENERRRLELDRMAMLLRRKEMEVELPRLQHAGPLHACSSNVHKRSEPSSLTG